MRSDFTVTSADASVGAVVSAEGPEEDAGACDIGACGVGAGVATVTSSSPGMDAICSNS